MQLSKFAWSIAMRIPREQSIPVGIKLDNPHWLIIRYPHILILCDQNIVRKIQLWPSCQMRSVSIEYL
jgi:hypothetical protein